jgi:hypothetical protein
VVVPKICGAGEYYMSKNFVNAKNERLYAVARKDSVFKQVYHAVVGKRKYKLMYFSTYFHMLVKGTTIVKPENCFKFKKDSFSPEPQQFSCDEVTFFYQ